MLMTRLHSCKYDIHIKYRKDYSRGENNSKAAATTDQTRITLDTLTVSDLVSMHGHHDHHRGPSQIECEQISQVQQSRFSFFD